MSIENPIMAKRWVGKDREVGARDFRAWANGQIDRLSLWRGAKLKRNTIAQQAGCTPEYLSRILTSPDFTVRPDLDMTIAIGTALEDPGAALEAAYGPVPGLLKGKDGPRLAEVLNAMPEVERTAILTLLEARGSKD